MSAKMGDLRQLPTLSEYAMAKTEMKDQTGLVGNEYTTEGLKVFIDFMEPFNGIMVRRHELFATFEQPYTAMRVSRMLNLDEMQKRQSIENPVFEMKLSEKSLLSPVEFLETLIGE